VDINIISDPMTTGFRGSANNEYSAKYCCRIFGRQRQNRQIEKCHIKPKNNVAAKKIKKMSHNYLHSKIVLSQIEQESQRKECTRAKSKSKVTKYDFCRCRQVCFCRCRPTCQGQLSAEYSADNVVVGSLNIMQLKYE
jgi:hypothetical protein